MYHNRVKISSIEQNTRHESVRYMITNRVIGGSFIFKEREKQKFLELLLEGQDRHAYKVIDYVLLSNHYHCILEIKAPEEMSRETLLKKWDRYYRATGKEPDEKTLDAFRLKIHDISFVVGNFEQRFVQWYNKRMDRLGSLFNRFDSVIIGGKHSLAVLMAYTTLNPVRVGMVTDPAEYHWCGYAKRVADGKLSDDDLELVKLLHRELHIPPQILKLSPKKQLKLLWKYFRIRLMNANVKAHVKTGPFAKHKKVGELVDNAGKNQELDQADHFMLKLRFATKGIAIGSASFVERVLDGCNRALGYKREHHPQQHNVWDQVCSLKRHSKGRVWI